MKRILSLTILIMSAFTIAAAQSVSAEDPHWCSGCSPIEKQKIAEQVNRASPAPGKSNTLSNGDPGFIPRQRTDPRSTPYQIKARLLVTNDSDKKIKRITWEYTMSNRETKAHIQTVTFVTEKTIAPRKSAVLKEKVIVPMQKLLGPTVPAGQASQKQPSVIEVEEDYQIREIRYGDGSVRKF